ncbi:MAG: hypothetical protein KDA85_01305 [Planctomycetaceae bacterium]|nr:hypothetical protein [Planctomycetaceae bacterium]
MLNELSVVHSDFADNFPDRGRQKNQAAQKYVDLDDVKKAGIEASDGCKGGKSAGKSFVWKTALSDLGGHLPCHHACFSIRRRWEKRATQWRASCGRGQGSVLVEFKRRSVPVG